MKMFARRTLFCVLMLSMLHIGVGFAGAAPRMEYIEGEALVVLDARGTLAALSDAALEVRLSAAAESAAASVGANAVRSYGALAAASGRNIVHMRAEGKTTKELLDALKKIPGVLDAAPNYVFRASVTTPNDPRYGELWGMDMINAPSAWDHSTGSAAVFVAVIDTGIKYDHPDLAANIGTDLDSNKGKDTVNGDNDPMDDHGHGTHVAGTIGAVGNNAIGVVGVNWTVSLLGVKVLGANGSGSGAQIIAGLNYVVDQKNRGLNIRVANMSLGGWGSPISNPNTDPYALAHKAVSDAGVVLVVAAGNEYQNLDNPQGPGSDPDDPAYDYRGKLNYPACFHFANMITVASITSTTSRSNFSNYSPTYVQLAAPGSAILSTTKDNGYSPGSGTSMATPHVAGAAALIAAAHPGETAGQIRARILNNTTTNANLTGKVTTGGHLNVAAAISGTAPAIPVTGVSVSPTESRLLIGETVALTSTVLPANADNRSVSWSSSTPSIASVSENGVVTAHANGSARITVRSDEGAHTAFCDITVAGSPPPQPPTPEFPIDGETGVPLAPLLKTGSYSHPQGLAHRATRWQISTENTFTSTESGASSSLSFDTTSTEDLLELYVPVGVLAQGTTYYWRTRFQDIERGWSGWSAARSFTTVSAPPAPTPSTGGSGGCALYAGSGLPALALLLPLVLILVGKTQ